MFLGKAFHVAWQAAGAGAKGAAAALATGAKTVGQIPVAMAHLENAAVQHAEAGLEAIARADLAAARAATVTASEWQGWMEVKSAKVLRALKAPVNVQAVERAGDQRTRELRRGFDGAQKAADKTFASIREQVQQASAARLKSAQKLRAEIAAGGAHAGEAVQHGVAAVGERAEQGLKAVDGAIVDKTLAGIWAAARLLPKKKTGDPVQACPLAQPDPGKQLSAMIRQQDQMIAEARRKGLGSDPRVLAAEAHSEASKKLLMAGDVYKENHDGGIAAPGWKRLSDAELRKLGLNPEEFHPRDSEFRAALYEGPGEPPRYTLAFKGTTMTSESDWRNNLRQGLGLKSDYYERAQQLAQKVKYKTHGNFEVTGHSLGGGLASAAAAATGARGVTFNAAGLNPETVEFADMNALNSRLAAYHVDGEVLTTVQNTPGLAKAAGKSELLPADPADNMVERHLTPALENAMIQTGAETGAKLMQITGVTVVLP